jgi:hypothetical protein
MPRQPKTGLRRPLLGSTADTGALAEMVRNQLGVIAGMFGRQSPKVETMLRGAADDLLA